MSRIVVVHADLLASNGAHIFAFECVFEAGGPTPRSILQIVASLIFPFLVIVILGAIWGLVAFLKRRPSGYFAAKLSASVLAVMYIAYIDITKNVLRIHDCAEADKKGIDPSDYAIATYTYWVIDPELQCRKGQHLLLFLAAGIPLLAVVTIGMPAVLLMFLSYQEVNSSKKGYIATYSFLCRAYRPGCKYWEVVIMVRKMLLAAIAVYSYSLMSNLQAVLALGVLAAALALHLWMRPFVEDGPNLNRLETISLMASFLSFLAGLIFNDPQTSDSSEVVTSIIVIGVLAGVFAYMLYELVLEVFKRIHTSLAQCKKAPCNVDENKHPFAKRIRLFWCALRLCMSAVPISVERDVGAHDGSSDNVEGGIVGAGVYSTEDLRLQQRQNQGDNAHVDWQLVGRLMLRGLGGAQDEVDVDANPRNANSHQTVVAYTHGNDDAIR